MSRLGTDRWRAVRPCLDQALEMEEGKRTAWIDSVAAADPQVAADLKTLLEGQDALPAEGFLENGLLPFLGDFV